MAGHVPKFGGGGQGNFAEVFTLARTGGSGSGSVEAREEGSNDGPPARSNPRPTGAPPPRRVSGEGLGGSSERQPPPRRPAAPRGEAAGGRGGSSRSGGSRNSKPMSDEGLYGNDASHIPAFGNWDAGGDPNFTVMFTAASKEKKTGVAADPNVGKGGGSGDVYSSSSRLPKKQGSSWWCFGRMDSNMGK